MDTPLYLRVRGRVLGPYDLEKLQSLVRRGQLGRMHEVSTDGVQWVQASTYAELFVGAPLKLGAPEVSVAASPLPDVEAGNNVPEYSVLDDIVGTAPSPSPADSTDAGPEPTRRRCPNCGEAIVATANQCRFCSAVFDTRQRGTPMHRGRSYQGFAVTSMVLGIVGIFAVCIGLLLGILAVIFGGVALKGMSRSRNNDGKGMAITGLVLGIIECAGWGIWCLILMIPMIFGPQFVR